MISVERSFFEKFPQLAARRARRYSQVDLCEADRIRFLAFRTDPAFGHCVDGLIRLELTFSKAAKRLR